MSLIHRPFRRVGVVNRGEAAVRFLRAARAWSRRRQEPLEVVALYTHPDREALFVREADSAVLLGDAMVPGPDGALRSAYLDAPRVLRLLVEAGCDAVWPGWGFVSERPDFADACAAMGLVFIGPSGASMRLLGDKIGGKRVAEEHGVVGLAHEHRVAVGVRIERDDLHGLAVAAGPRARGAQEAHGGLPPVDDPDTAKRTVEQGHQASGSFCGLASGPGLTGE